MTPMMEQRPSEQDVMELSTEELVSYVKRAQDYCERSYATVAEIEEQISETERRICMAQSELCVRMADIGIAAEFRGDGGDA